MIIGVTGPNGRLGSELVQRGYQPIRADVTDFHALGLAIAQARPDVIVHCAAYTNVDACETSPIRAAKVNMGGVFGLTEIFRGRIVYISTDYIFDGRYGPYTELDTPNPLGVYGWSKLGGEIVLKQHDNPGDLVVRTTVLFDRYSPNFVTRVAEQLRGGQVVQAPAALYGSPTYIPHLADGIIAAVAAGVSGVVNIAGSRVISRKRLAELVAQEIGLPPEMVHDGPVTGQAARPSRAGLVVDKARALGLPIYDPVEGIKEITANALETMAAG